MNINERALETFAKGFASRRRINILFFLRKEPESDLANISAAIKLEIKSTSEHVRKMTIAGLVMKRYDGHHVRHALTERGKKVCTFLEHVTRK